MLLMPTSSEFMALCKSQVTLLSKGLGSSVSVVYLTEELVEGNEAKLIPVVAYPDTAVVWEENPALAIDPYPRPPDSASTPSTGETRASNGNGNSDRSPGLMFAAPAVPMTAHLVESWKSASEDWRIEEDGDELAQHRQMVLPLMHEGVVMGLLVTRREDRPWTERERTQIERIAHTIAIACILDRRQAWLSQQLRAQQRLQAQQHDLLDNLLHQIRSPLTALRTFGKLLFKRLREPDPNREIASSIVRESDRVQELLQHMNEAIEVENLEAMPDGEAEQVSATPMLERRSPQLLLPASPLESCDVVQVLEPLLISARAIAQERCLRLQVNIPPEVPTVRANPKALREVLSNLIDNALKYTPTGGEIYIQVGDLRQVNDTLQLAIALSDTGTGIPPEDIERLFQRYYRGVKAESEIPGTGLGLAIARELVAQMQGDIEVFSPTPPQWRSPQWEDSPDPSHPGATFIVWLPIDSHSI